MAKRGIGTKTLVEGVKFDRTPFPASFPTDGPAGTGIILNPKRIRRKGDNCKKYEIMLLTWA